MQKWKEEIAKCQDPVINLRSFNIDNWSTEYYRAEHAKDLFLLKYINNGFNKTITIWSRQNLKCYFNCYQKVLGEFVVEKFKKHNNIKISTLLLAYKSLYIKLFKKIGFEEEVYFREHIYIDKFFDVVLLAKDNIEGEIKC